MIFTCDCGAPLIEEGGVFFCARPKGRQVGKKFKSVCLSNAPASRVRAAGALLGAGIGNIRVPVIHIERTTDHKCGWQIGDPSTSYAVILGDEPIQLQGVSPIDFEVE